MNEYAVYIIIASGSLLLGALLSYLYARSKMVERSLWEESRTQNAELQSRLESNEVLLEESKRSRQEWEKKWADEQEKRLRQEKEFAALAAELNALRQRLEEWKSAMEEQKKQQQSTQAKLLQLETEKAAALATNRSLQEKIKKLDEEFAENRKKSLIEFENIANRIMEEKSSKFSKQSKTELEQLLKPLRENLSEFKKKVEETYDKESKERFSLESRIKELVQLNQQISKDATNLTNALKGQAKTQGNWGEMILENILEYSGLVKDREYFVQASYQDEDGKRKQPDIKIKYPNDRYIIIDSKVSLTAYERYANCEDPEEQKVHLKQHIQSLRNHIDNLSSKEYDRIDKTLDFVMLFVPIEPAYMTAIHHDQELWNYAYQKRILLISPTNLIAALKMVADIWKREYQNVNALKIAKRGQMLYEKFVNFVADMEDIEKALNKLNDKYNDAMNKLSKGRGNLIGQAESLKKLGISTQKRLSEKRLSESDVPPLEDE